MTRKENKAFSVNNFVKQVGIIEDGEWFKVTFVDSNGMEDVDLKRKMIILKKLAWVTLVRDLRVQRLQQRGENIINKLWDVFMKNTDSIIPTDWLDRFNNDDSWCSERFVADYLSGMTDSYAEKLYEELYGSLPGSIYDLD